MPEGKHTPQGYLIEPESGKKFISVKGIDNQLGYANGCELELWKMRAELVRALERITREYRACYPQDTGGICKLPQTIIDAEAALAAAGKGN